MFAINRLIITDWIGKKHVKKKKKNRFTTINREWADLYKMYTETM